MSSRGKPRIRSRRRRSLSSSSSSGSDSEEKTRVTPTKGYGQTPGQTEKNVEERRRKLTQMSMMTTGHSDEGMSLVTGPLSELYTLLVQLDTRFDGLDIGVPVAAIIGYQTHGKTSVLMQLVRLPVGFSKGGTATRCPMRYVLKNDMECQQPRVLLNGSEVPYNKLHELLAAHMESIARTSLISDRECEIEIRWSGAPNLCVYDLPGCMPHTQTEERHMTAKQIDDMVRRYILMDNIIPIVVRRAEDPDTDPTVDHIDKLVRADRPDWKKKAFFVINKFDIKMAELNEPADFEEFIQGSRQRADKEGAHTVLVMANPGGKSIGDLELGDRISYVQEVCLTENRLFREYFEGLRQKGASQQFLSQTVEMCGLPRLVQHLQAQLTPHVRAALEGVPELMAGHADDLRERLHACQNKMESLSAGRLREEILKFINRLQDLTSVLLKGHFAAEDMPGLRFEDVALTWFEEVEQFEKSRDYRHAFKKPGTEWQHYQEPDDLEHTLKENKLDHLVLAHASRKSGLGSLQRVLQLWEFMVWATPFPNLKEENIMNAARPLGSTVHHDFDTGVRNVTAIAMKSFRQAHSWLAAFAKFIIRRTVRLVRDWLLKNEFEHLALFRKNIIRDVFRDYVSELTRKVDDFEAVALATLDDLRTVGNLELPYSFHHAGGQFKPGVTQVPGAEADATAHARAHAATRGRRRAGAQSFGNADDEPGSTHNLFPVQEGETTTRGEGSDEKTRGQTITTRPRKMTYFTRDARESGVFLLRMTDTPKKEERPNARDVHAFAREIKKRAYDMFRPLKWIVWHLTQHQMTCRVINPVCLGDSSTNQIGLAMQLGVSATEQRLREVEDEWKLTDSMAFRAFLKENGVVPRKPFMQMTEVELQDMAGPDIARLRADLEEAREEYREFQAYEKEMSRMMESAGLGRVTRTAAGRKGR